MHRDIKPQNIFIDTKTMKVKVGDFGLARIFNVPFRPYSYEISTIHYKAPEIILKCRNYGVGIDIWSLGCVFAEMFTGKVIFRGCDEMEVLNGILA